MNPDNERSFEDKADELIRMLNGDNNTMGLDFDDLVDEISSDSDTKYY